MPSLIWMSRRKRQLMLLSCIADRLCRGKIYDSANVLQAEHPLAQCESVPLYSVPLKRDLSGAFYV